MQVAVVASQYGNPWREQDVLARRIAGALACSAEVEVLFPGQGRMAGHDGAVSLRSFPSTPIDAARRLAWRRSVLGQRDGDAFHCSCHGAPGWELPRLAEEELIRAEGGDSPELYDYLRETPVDLVVFIGCHSPAACWGIRALPDHQRIALVPAIRERSALWLRIHDESFERAESIIAMTDTEAAVLARRVGRRERVANLGFVVGVNRLAESTAPHDFDCDRYVVIAANWATQRPPMARIHQWADQLRHEVDPELQLRLAGPGAESLPLGIKNTDARLDVWRWVCRSIALLDPMPHHVMGLEVLEAMLFGVPVVTNAEGGASRDHAELGNGGLWYRTSDELCAVIRALMDDDLRRTLGQQGQAYAEEHYADPDGYVKRVTDLLLS